MPWTGSTLVASPREGTSSRHRWQHHSSSPDAHLERCVACGTLRRTVETTPGQPHRSYQAIPSGPWRHHALRCGAHFANVSPTTTKVTRS